MYQRERLIMTSFVLTVILYLFFAVGLHRRICFSVCTSKIVLVLCNSASFTLTWKIQKRMDRRSEGGTPPPPIFWFLSNIVVFGNIAACSGDMPVVFFVAGVWAQTRVSHRLLLFAFLPNEPSHILAENERTCQCGAQRQSPSQIPVHLFSKHRTVPQPISDPDCTFRRSCVSL